MGEREDRLPMGSPEHVRRWSRLVEVLTGYDSIATVEHWYEDVGRCWKRGAESRGGA